MTQACDGPQSTLVPAGKSAEQIAELFWWMVAGAILIWFFVVGLSVYAIVVRPGEHEHRRATMLIIGGGVIFPTIVLTILLVYGLSLLPPILEPVPDGSLTIEVSGEQWWWRVRYLLPDGNEFETANEVRLPVGEPVQFFLESPDVVHSFWIPSIGGKVDMIPGRRTRLKLEPTRTGAFRGACAEYCGTSHGLMNFDVFVESPEEYEAWVGQQQRPSTADRSGSTGLRIFLEAGCGACHTIRGTDADGVVGPDLTHVGSRTSIGAGVLPNDEDGFMRWISDTDAIKPGVHMPAFGVMEKSERLALAEFLDGLE
ncbi:MAG: cytochrome c oxidase subunit II [Thermoanaerobaculia bacterium]|nr:cytochrome c oxidase subunit II [Thermoanaerobaculia bacterium]